MIAGIRQCELPSPMRPLRLSDLHLIGLHPVEVSNGAIVLKRCLENDFLWNKLITKLGQVKARLLQTSDAFLVSPSLRSKARFMNVASMLKWLRKILELLDRGSDGGSASTRAEARYGWLRAYRGAINHWCRAESTVSATVSYTRTHGLRLGGEWDLLKMLGNRPSCCLGTRIIGIVQSEVAEPRPLGSGVLAILQWIPLPDGRGSATSL